MPKNKKKNSASDEVEKKEVPAFKDVKLEELNTDTLRGDIRDAMLSRIRNLQKPWQQCSEGEQTSIIAAASETADHLVKEAVRLVASQGRKVITATLDQVTIKGELKAVVKMPKTDENRHELFDAQGTAVLIVVADSKPFEGQKAEAKPDPDQKDMLNEEEEFNAAA